ncbi:M20 metallopeptidase family protein [Parashewanella tropica]|uniref:M20 metallopeptidase family protein n=1 Tax=Parashewanella tropica TaxID=2547970 RepID=UPI0014789661|nr:amidohydrolase [Parashewanella tropica]
MLSIIRRTAVALGISSLLLIISNTAFSETHVEGSKAMKELIPKLEKLYLHFHQYPELSFHENKTSQIISQQLKTLGFDVTDHYGGYGVVGLYKNGKGPTVMIRTDMDALPVTEETGLSYASKVTSKNSQGETIGVMHACGHDLHMTSFIGTATMLMNKKDQWHGTLIMIAQPAEEYGAGAKAMLDAGLYKDFPVPDHIIGLHDHAGLPAGKVAIAPNYIMANVDSVDITVKGISGHGAYPNKTIDPIVIASRIVLALQTIVSREISPLDPSLITVGVINGGTKRNIIGNKVLLQLTVRSYNPKVRKKLLSSIKRTAKYIAKSAGVNDKLLPDVKVYKDESGDAVFNDPKQTAKVKSFITAAIGKDNVVHAEQSMVGEDVSQYALTKEKIPLTFFWLGAVNPKTYAESIKNGTELPTLHSSKFAPDYPLAIKTGVKAMTASAIGLFNDH